MLRQPLAEHLHVIAEIVLNDGAKSRTLEPDVLPAIRASELRWDRLSSARATKLNRLGAICWPE
jgi:hypothetical protein